VTLGHLALIMRTLGCVDAMNLDGGASMAMYYRGRVILPAGRRLTNILTIHER
jgi:exopolysaccharide biosynthesis protein